MQMNNISAKAAYLRDTFLDCEKDYVKALRKNPRFYRTVEKFNQQYTSDKLYAMAVYGIARIESGEVSSDELEKEEFLILASLSAIIDYQKVLEKVFMPDDFEIGGR